MLSFDLKIYWLDSVKILKLKILNLDEANFKMKEILLRFPPNFPKSAGQNQEANFPASQWNKNIIFL